MAVTGPVGVGLASPDTPMTWPDGIQSAGAACGIKRDGAPDLGLIVVQRPAAWAGTFTRNAAAAAPVRWSRSRLGFTVRALVVNSGNANACTGAGGEAAVMETTGKAAAELGCRPDEILVASTGPIGVPLPVDRIVASMPAVLRDVGPAVEPFATAILTSDTRMKTAVATGSGFRITGVAKGAAMLAPNMATMLAFIGTDAALDGVGLQQALRPAVARSFDRISVDACESTNDSVFLVSSGTADHPDPEEFGAALASVCSDLAEQMVRDAEGGSKLVRIRVAGAATEAEGVALGRAVAASALWRAAAHGGDPNWGRVLSALGSVDRGLDLNTVSAAVGDEVVFAAGEPTGSLEAAAGQMAGDEFTVACKVGSADTFVEVLTSDLSPAYVSMNATGTS